MVRLLTRIILAVTVLLISSYGYLLWRNNQHADLPDASAVKTAYEQTVNWLISHEDELLKQNNPMLWSMVQRSASLSGDHRIEALFRKYQDRYLVHQNLWRPLFEARAWIPVRYQDIANLPYYNKHFIYALTCDSDLAQHPDINSQNNPDFCDTHRLRPACVTHQLMGIRIMQAKQCLDGATLKTTQHALLSRIEQQLTWDMRVVDVYLQRVLMLLESGQTDQIKPIWIQHVLAAQLNDGSWGPTQPLISLPGNRSLGFTQRAVGIIHPRPSFHATAQGLFILTLLQYPNLQPDAGWSPD